MTTDFSDLKAKAGHLASNGPLNLPRKTSQAASEIEKRKQAWERLKRVPVVLNWGKK